MGAIWTVFKGLSIGTKLALIGGILAFLLAVGGGVYWTGYTKGHSESKVAIAQYEAKSAQLDAKIKGVHNISDVRYVTQYKDRVVVETKTVTQNHDVIKYRVPEQFKFSNGWVYAYNQSVQGLPIDEAKASDATASWVSDRTGLNYINDNNGICRINSAQLDNLIAAIKAREEGTKNVIENNK